MTIISKLKPGVKVRIGEKSSVKCGFQAGEVVTLQLGSFDYENGFWTETIQGPAVWNETVDDWDSVYHIWGNDLEDFLDCEIIEGGEDDC